MLPNIQQTVIEITWPPPNGSEFVMNYILEYTSVSRVDQQMMTRSVTISNNQTSFNLTPPTLQPNSDYTFQVFANFGNGVVTQIVAPFTAVSQEAGTLELYWYT